MKKSAKSGTNTSRKTTVVKRGTGKSQPTSPSVTHKSGGAVRSPRKAKGPLDNRGKGPKKR